MPLMPNTREITSRIGLSICQLYTHGDATSPPTCRIFLATTIKVLLLHGSFLYFSLYKIESSTFSPPLFPYVIESGVLVKSKALNLKLCKIGCEILHVFFTKTDTSRQFVRTLLIQVLESS